MMRLISPKDKTTVSRQDLVHDYVETVVVEKYSEPGTGWWWFYNPPKYVVVSKDETGGTWTTLTTMDFYNSVNEGDKLEICKNHMIPKVLEQ